ncbi:MAG TPA: CoA transferase [Anaerolineales bacterium]|nr:CoA transferase [Anaerolineales bacterium]
MTQPTSLLDSVLVVDLTRVLAGPFCTMMLGDLGAEVIKIEEPKRGDDTRGWGPPFTPGGESAYFLSANRNKRSLTLNLKDPQGLEIVRRLTSSADVLVENFRAGTMETWGLDYEALQKLRPGLIVCSITGFGQDGPYRDRPGYDFMVQAMGGFMSVTGPEDGEPYRAGIAIADLAAGMFAASAILAALFARERTGAGQRIDISLLDSQVAMLSYVASNYLITGERPRRYGNGHPNIVPYQAFAASDGFFAFAAGNDGQWKRFCQSVGKGEWAEDPRFATNGGRVQNRAPLVALLNELFSSRPGRDWMELCQSIGVPAAPINPIDQVFEDPQVVARGMRQEAAHASEGSVPLVGSPLCIPTAPVRMRRAPPTLGQHTDEILAERLGCTPDQISAWRQTGVV